MRLDHILVEKKDWAVKKAINEISEAAGDEADLVAGFRYYLEDNLDREDWCEGFAKNVKFKVSLRSRKNFNVRNLALHYGGGGHVKAASFVENVGHRHENPYRRIIELICDYELQTDFDAT